ncbi:DUF3530 family protein [Aliidiomarina sp. B3213]|nr:DUF3530 family protein [Aliidiomarina sp. B3213]
MLPLFIIFYISQPLQAGQDDLAYYLPPHEYFWLGDSEESRYLVLHRENQLPFLRGAAIILPDWGFHPLTTTYSKMSYQAMPQYGWETLAVHAPTSDLSTFPWQTENGTPYPTAAEDRELDDIRQQVLTRVEAVMTHLADEPGFRILISEGVSAGIVIDLISRGELTDIDALVVINPNIPQWQLNREMSRKLARLDIPTLDLQSSEATHWSLEEAERRVMLASRYQHMGYRQRGLSPQTHRQNEHTFAQVIYGWLSYEGF